MRVGCGGTTAGACGYFSSRSGSGPVLSLLPRPNLQVDRAAMEAELLPQPALDEPDVARVHPTGGEEDERRRRTLCLGSKQDPRLLPAADRMWVGGDQPAEEGVQLA